MATLTRVRETPVSRPRSRTDHRLPVPPGVLFAALVVVIGRLPFVDGFLGQDEAGFLAVARQWRPGGTSLYGNYWVDRPPLLITIFRAAALLGGAVPLRLIGIAAAAVTVVAVGATAHRVSGSRANATWASVAAAALLISPAAGATEVNGELLAAPFVAVGLAALVHGFASHPHRSAMASAGVAGAAAAAAVLVKQNMLDVVVFAVALAAFSFSSLGARRIAALTASFAAGAAGAVGLVAAWTVAHGTSLNGVWFAMYQFRVEAGKVMAADPSARAAMRGQHLLVLLVLNGMALAAGLVLLGVLRRRRDHPSSSPQSRVRRAVVVALAATISYDAVSIFLGGSYWSHYLVQLVVPLSLGIGLATQHLPRAGRGVAIMVTTSSAVALLVAGPHPTPAGGNAVGDAISRVAHPGDTIVSIWGHPDVTGASGLSSPYPYLWWLPERTLDPRFDLLTSTLLGTHAPTWFVTRTGTGLGGVNTSHLAAALGQDYHRVAIVHRSSVYLHDGVQRAGPT